MICLFTLGLMPKGAQHRLGFVIRPKRPSSSSITGKGRPLFLAAVETSFIRVGKFSLKCLLGFFLCMGCFGRGVTFANYVGEASHTLSICQPLDPVLVGRLDGQHQDFNNLTRFGFLQIWNQKLFLWFNGEVFSVPSTFLLGKQSAFSLFEILSLDGFYRRQVIAAHIGDSPLRDNRTWLEDTLPFIGFEIIGLF